MSSGSKPDPKPYLKHECQGHYMEPGKPWTGADDSGESLCMHCDVNQICWKHKNEKPGAEAPGDPPARG